jgi:hypothetical protein
MTVAEAFTILQTLGPAPAVDRWGPDAMQAQPVIEACSITLAGLLIDPPDSQEESTVIMAHLLWLVAIAFEAGRIYEGGVPE